METINVTFRMNKKDKQEFEEVIKGLGLNLSSAFNVFNRNGLPFKLKNREPSKETKGGFIMRSIILIWRKLP